ncbi:hypothetical protein B0H11DRAFT_1721549, partial [Mycena galericulata]
LQEFFSSYPKYKYDPSGPASQQFQQLRKVYRWDNKGVEANEAYQGYNKALSLTFSEQYGDDVNSLANWQRLCRTVEIPVRDSLEECKRAIEDVHVNLIDLVDIHNTGKPVHRFASEYELSVYTKQTKKFFPPSHLYKGPLLKYLLRHIFAPRGL